MSLDHNVLKGIKLIAFFTDETVAAEAYATMTLLGWENQLELVDQFDELLPLLTQNKEGVLVLLQDSDAVICGERINQLLDSGLLPSELVIAIPQGALSHRILAKAGGFGNFVYSNETTPLGPQLDLSMMVDTLLRQLNLLRANQISSELKRAENYGALSMLDSFLKFDVRERSINRTYLAVTLYDRVSANLKKRRKLIRFALFYNLSGLPNFEDVFSKASELWELQEYYTAAKALLSGSTAPLPIEVAVTSIANLLSSTHSPADPASDPAYQQILGLLPFEFRASLKIAVTDVLASITEKTEKTSARISAKI